MPTPAERQALLFVAAVALIGGGMRVVQSRRLDRELSTAEQGNAPAKSLGARALDAQIAAVDSARANRRTSRRKASVSSTTAVTADAGTGASRTRRTQPTLKASTAPDPTPRIDVNEATVEELERLPRVGPALAARIVAWREKNGPFDALESLRHVRGIGPATARLLAPLVTFSGRHSPSQSEASASPATARRTSPSRNL